MNFFRDAAWQLIGAFLGIAAIIVTLVVYRRQRSIKLLEYDFASSVSLFSYHGVSKENIKITYNSREISSASAIVARFKNVGNTPIARADYDECLRIDIEGKGKIANYEIFDKDPRSLKIEIEDASNNNGMNKHIVFKPFLLNRR